MKTKTNDPHYLKCPIKYDWDIASGETSSKVIAKISSFLQANGFVRNKKITRWKAKAKEKKENEEGEASSHHSDQTSELSVRDKSSEICEKSTSHIRKVCFSYLNDQPLTVFSNRCCISVKFFIRSYLRYLINLKDRNNNAST